MPDFWRSSGWHLCAHRADGRLMVTDELLRAYFRRPEIRPVAESCEAERSLHAALLEQPRLAVSPERLATLADADARENYAVLLAFRDRLLAASSLEEAYLGLFGETRVPVPPLFVDQLAHIITRHILNGTEDPLRARAAELFFRPQSVSIRDGAVMFADQETVEMHAATGGFGEIGRLLVEAQTPLATVELDVLDEANGAAYWSRDERYDTVFDLGFTRPGLDALCRVLEAWVRHFLAVEVHIHPVQQIRDERWVWHLGLDAEANSILNDLYNGAEVGDERLARLLRLFRLEFADPHAMRADLAGRPVYLGLAMTAAKTLRLKPQNLLVNLPLASRT